MKKLTKIYCTLVVIICTLFVGIYAWTTRVDFLDINNVTISSTSGYYESGKGTEDDPFIISRPKHLYNLAWLQDLGFYDDDQYYFELKNDIDMENLWIPPIGTQDHPFIGNFNGNGKLINNVRVGTNTLRLGEKFDANDIKGVGLFGFISDNGATDTFKKIGNVSNFTISDIYVECALSNQYSGLIAGNVEANLSNVGVYTGRISYLGTADNQIVPISEYTLIGYVNENKVDWEDKPESASGNNLILNGTGFKEVSKDEYSIIPNSSAILVGEIKSTSKKVSSIKYSTKTSTGYDDSEFALTQGFNELWENNKDSGFTTLRLRNSVTVDANGYLTENEIFKTTSEIKTEHLNLPVGFIFPQGCVWFQTQVTGTCYMAFVRDGDSYTAIMEVFNLASDNIGIKVTNIGTFTNEATAKNEILLCRFDITSPGTYIIVSTTNETVTKAGHFIYLELVGTGEEGGDVNEKILNVDFVPSSTTIIDSNYTNELKSNVLIEIGLTDGTQYIQSNVILYFKRKDDGTEVNYQINGNGISIGNVGTGTLKPLDNLTSSDVFQPIT